MGFKCTFTLILPFILFASAYAFEEFESYGAPVEKNPTDVKYTILAQEALAKYENDIVSPISFNVLEVTKVIEQIVSGTLYTIDFLGAPTDCSKVPPSECTIIDCHTEILDVPWLNKREITINCKPANITE